MGSAGVTLRRRSPKTVHFSAEALFRRLRQYDAYRTLWRARGDPPPTPPLPLPLEKDFTTAKTAQARRDLLALATVHWRSRSRSPPQRSASLVAIAVAWDQLEGRGLHL